MSSTASSSRILPHSFYHFVYYSMYWKYFYILHCTVQASKVWWSRCDCGGRRSCLRRRRRCCGCWWRYVCTCILLHRELEHANSIGHGPDFWCACTTEHSRAHLLASDEAWIKIHVRCAFGKSKHVIFVHSGWDNAAAAMAPPSLLWDCRIEPDRLRPISPSKPEHWQHVGYDYHL